MNALFDYVNAGYSRLPGWLFRVDGEIFRELLECQNGRGVEGSVAEIGIHHGKSFIALCLALKGSEAAYGIDLFDDQSANLDHSGHGVRAIVEANLSRFNVPAHRVVLDARSSELVVPDDILQKVGRIRFFSVDGGHWQAIVVNDLELASKVLADGGIIALDDFLRPEWPDVSRGFFEWFASRPTGMVPFAIGYNKLFLCGEAWRDIYMQQLKSSRFLQAFFRKHYDFCGARIPVYQDFPLPEWSLRRRLEHYCKQHHPNLFVRWHHLRRRLGIA